MKETLAGVFVWSLIAMALIWLLKGLTKDIKEKDIPTWTDWEE